MFSATGILIDLVLVAALFLAVARGAKKGFILTLCSLVAVLVAFIGANIVSDAAAPMVADTLQPKLEQSIQEILEERALEVGNTGELAATEALAALREKGGFYELAADGLENFLSLPDLIQSPSVAELAAHAAAAIAAQLAKGLLFVAAFFIILLLWTILSHALDLVSRLPGINALNHTLGGAIGLVKGLIIVYVVVWVLYDLTGYISPETAGQTYLFSFLTQHSPMDLLNQI